MKSEQRPKEIRIGSLSIKRTILILFSIGVIAIPILYYLYNQSFLSPRNYAADVAKPLEDALVKAGAVKKCTQGDNGRSIDNRMPWHQSYWELAADRDTAVSTMTKIAKENGYTIQQATVDDRGSVTVGDEFLHRWFFDVSAKPSTFQDLQSGKVDLQIAVNNDGDFELGKLTCGTSDHVNILSNAQHSAITISVRLPAFK